MFSDPAVASKNDSGKKGIRVRFAKTDQKGDGSDRLLTCMCDGNIDIFNIDTMPMCPACIIPFLHNQMLSELTIDMKPDMLLFPKFGSMDTANAKMSYQEVLKTMRALLRRTGTIVENDNGKNLFGLHSCRRGGAQSFAAAGVPLSVIKRMGRWSPQSVVVDRYILDIPLDTHNELMSSSFFEQKFKKINHKDTSNAFGKINEYENNSSKNPTTSSRMFVGKHKVGTKLMFQKQIDEVDPDDDDPNPFAPTSDWVSVKIIADFKTDLRKLADERALDFGHLAVHRPKYEDEFIVMEQSNDLHICDSFWEEEEGEEEEISNSSMFYKVKAGVDKLWVQ